MAQTSEEYAASLDIIHEAGCFSRDATPLNTAQAPVEEYAASLQLIREAQARIAPFAKVTPVHTCGTLDRLMSDAECPVELFFKCETFQKGGAFKFRGAINSILSLSDAEAGPDTAPFQNIYVNT